MGQEQQQQQRSPQQHQQQLHLPAGFRFHPTDEELVVSYLAHKAESRPFPIPIIAEVDLYKYDPWELPEKAFFGEREWYFFSPRDRKYPNGARPNRAAASGYWKATGTDKPIVQQPQNGAAKGAANCKKVGVKKALVFYKGKAPKGIKTNWIMHEYRLAESKAPLLPARKKGSLRLDDWVLCRIYKKSSGSALKAMIPPAVAAKQEPRQEEELEDVLASLPDIENNSDVRARMHQRQQQQQQQQPQQQQQHHHLMGGTGASFLSPPPDPPGGMIMEELISNSHRQDQSDNASGSLGYYHPYSIPDMATMMSPGWPSFDTAPQHHHHQQQQQQQQDFSMLPSPFRSMMNPPAPLPQQSPQPVKLESVTGNLSDILAVQMPRKRSRLPQGDEDDVQSTCRSPAPRQRQGFFGFLDLPSTQHPVLF